MKINFDDLSVDLGLRKKIINYHSQFAPNEFNFWFHRWLDSTCTTYLFQAIFLFMTNLVDGMGVLTPYLITK